MAKRIVGGVLILAALFLTPLGVFAQIPGTSSLPTSLPSKDTLLQQAKSMVSDLTSLKGSGKLDAAQTKQVDGMLPKAQSLTTELEKPQVPPNKLTQLASQLSDLQKQYTTLKGLIK